MTVRDRVLIAGAGPVGVTVALALARQGVPVTLYEKRSTYNTASKASTFHPPTIEVWDALGVAAMPLAIGLEARSIGFFDTREGSVARFDFRLLEGETRFPFRLHLEQHELTRVMLEAVAAQPGARIVYDAEVLGARTDGTRAVARVRAADGERDESAAFVIGADGASSSVRQSLGLAFDGVDYTNRVVRIMTPVDLSTLAPAYSPVSYIYDGDRSISLLAGRDVWRIVIRIPGTMTDAQVLDPAFADAEIARFMPVGRTPLPVAYRDVYGASRRVASSYRVGRVVLAGDAAHLTNTRGGLNMNCGIHDAWVLSGAILAALGGADADAELERYAVTRRAIAVDRLIPQSDHNVSAGRERLDEMRRTVADPEAARRWLRRTSFLDLSPIRKERPDGN